jgi:hypothetical protein
MTLISNEAAQKKAKKPNSYKANKANNQSTELLYRTWQAWKKRQLTNKPSYWHARPPTFVNN